jgi:hypothetical protein
VQEFGDDVIALGDLVPVWGWHVDFFLFQRELWERSLVGTYIMLPLRVLVALPR